MGLRERCTEVLHEISMTSGRGDCIDTLMAFVVAETGRSADHALDKSLPLCLYFVTEADIEEFIEAYHLAHPNTRTKRIP
jgi:hypothetical protein